jgi:hypothetical protein
MPGALVDLDYGNNKETAWGFTYSTRIAVYKVIPQTAIVAEVYGTEGKAYSKPECKVGLRWNIIVILYQPFLTEAVSMVVWVRV